ncbi:hypothetical protein [Plebeiibacterium marinum]|uniref:Uncharacterized protein n=1 Tax=Plebeiibacterium marinum TaxID=2992111 RepID=A0AAE3SJJ9_9BACT|nr:hypothetical protein [Plebeiobacterium marinum]MCW3805554.1 hypothetical protein [Plebeiobacterium marinum]
MVTSGRKIYFYIISLLIINTSCIREAYYITGNAVVIDDETLAPVSNSSIVSQCFYQENIDKSSFDIQHSKTDSLGSFSLEFNKGYKISMVIDAEDYMKNIIQYNPRRDQLPDTIYLKRRVSFETSAAKAPKANLLEKKLGQ